MSTGNVVGIYISPRRGEPTIWVEQIHVIPGCGIEGDRYFRLPGTPNDHPKTGRELTLVELEAIEAMCREGLQISPDQTRRNIITRGIALNDLVGKQFSVGIIRLLGIRLCEPCDYLAGKTDPRVVQSMSHRGGLRADILTDGFIRLNDLITTI
jgi:MOSC domain-containing protein YiiM